jgi:adenosine deaminase
MLNCFEVFLPIVRGNLVLIEELAFDFCKRQWEQNVVYTEVRYSPHLLAEGLAGDIADEEEEASQSEYDFGRSQVQVTPDDVFDAVTRGLRRGCATFDQLVVNQILCGIAWKPHWAMSTLEMATRHQEDFPCAAVGVDIAAGEEHFDQKNFPGLYHSHYAMAQEAKQRSMPMTLHAGESTENALQNIKRAITDYGACRIGHGYRMTESPAVMQLVRENGVHVEVCPTSSNETGGWVYNESTNGSKDWSKHPAVTMRENGIAMSISADDPAVFHTSLAWQYRLVLAKMKLSRRDLLNMNMDAIEAAWCSEALKDKLRGTVRTYGNSTGVDGFEHDQQAETPPKLLVLPKKSTFRDRVYIKAHTYS